MEVGSAALADSTQRAKPGASFAAEVVRPAPDAKVFHQSMPLYHWHTDCPLADAKSIRPGKPSTPMQRTFMSRTQAEKHSLFPCIYCGDLDSK
jgi:hypothetical protein